MPLSNNKGPTSGFAAAAKVLFESAQKVGAVKPLEKSNREYAQQLKKIQHQSKKRGGSLGGVSYKVAEFLSTQRTFTPSQNRETYMTIAKKVPLIDIPALKSTTFSEKVTASSANDSTPVQPAGERKKTEAVPISFIESPIVEVTPVSTASKVSSAVERPTASAATSASQFPDVLITDDEPLFQFRSPEAAGPMSSTVVTSRVESFPAPTAAAKARLKPIIQVPIPKAPLGDANFEAAATDQKTVMDTSISVDMWELQREKEIARLQQDQEEAEARRLAVLREEEHKTLGAKWVHTRSRVANFKAADSEEVLMVCRIYNSQSAGEAAAHLKALLEVGARIPIPLLTSAVSSTAWQIASADSFSRAELDGPFFELLEKHKVTSDVVAKATMTLRSGDEFLEAYRNLTAGTKKILDVKLVKRAVSYLVRRGQWEEAIALVEQSHTYSSDKAARLELALLRSSRGLDDEAKASVCTYVTSSLTNSGRLGKEAKLALASSETGRNRVNSLIQLSLSSDVDEAVYAELILRNPSDAVPELLAEMEKRGLNKEDPAVLGALAMKSLGSESPLAVFKEIEQQIQMIGLRQMHVYAAVRAVKKNPSKEGLTLAANFVKEAHTTNQLWATRNLLPRMYEKGMFSEIVALSDALATRLPVKVLLPKAVAFINEALVQLGREPLSSLTVKDIDYVATEEAENVNGSSASSHPIANVSREDIAAITEKMLIIAKEKQWEKALEMLDSVRTGNADNAAAVTLIYNCALNAAVDTPDIVQRVYSMMQERSVAINSTSVNTVLSSYSRANLWKEAVELFDSTASGMRDNNTYLVQLSLLGKQNLWMEAVSVYADMRKAMSKPPTSMFSLAIGATASHSWSATLSMFQDMLKLHGASVKENVVNQVVRCLEQNNRTAELVKLEKDLEKRKKRK